jgi:hypothetical protein
MSPEDQAKATTLVQMLVAQLGPMLVQVLGPAVSQGVGRAVGPEMARTVAQSLGPQLVQAMQSPLAVEKVNPDTDELEPVQTTFPQILVDLTDALLDLVDILDEKEIKLKAKSKKRAG